MVALVGDLSGDLLAGLARSPNVSVARLHSAARPRIGPRENPAVLRPGKPGWAAAAEAMREAARRRSMYVIVPADPLAGVAASWQQMWDPAGGLPGAAEFEASAAEALVAWRAKQFELPDYYLIAARAQGSFTSPDFYLGPLRAVRPRRVAVAGLPNGAVHPGGTVAGTGRHGAPRQHGAHRPAPCIRPPCDRPPVQTSSLLDALRSLHHGPWWPPLDEVLEAARGFYAGGLAETQQLAT